MTKEYLIATHNPKKRDELSRIAEPFGARILLDYEAGVTLSDVEETGSSFEENALLKARSGCRESSLACIADDSGLCVDALGGAPGVYSARFAGAHGDDGANIVKLLRALEGVPESRRTARFVSVVCCVRPDGTECVVRGECEGKIALSARGSGGFGYDPVFLPDDAPGRTMAQLSAEEKDAISHRGKALRLLARKL